MPTYQYACIACEERTEAVQKFSDDPLTVCPACGGKLRKLFSPVGIVFKGSGFYRTDSRVSSSNGSTDKSSSNGSSSDSASTSEKSSGADKKPSSPDPGSSPGPAKPASTPGAGKSASTGKTASTGTKVA